MEYVHEYTHEYYIFLKQVDWIENLDLEIRD